MTPKPRTRTYAYALQSMRTLRFLLINQADRLTRIANRQVLRMTSNQETEALYTHISYIW